MSDTFSLFPPFGDPWPSCLLPSQYTLISCLFQEEFPIHFEVITKAVFISTVSSNNHDLCWYYKDTSILQWTVIVFFLQMKDITIVTNFCLTLIHGKTKWSLTSWQPPDISRQWQTPLFKCSLSILHYGILNLLMEIR